MADLTPSPFVAIVKSRKGLAALAATIVGSLYAVALTVSYFQGKFSPDAYFTHLKAAGAAVMTAWIAYIWGTATEDAATKGQSQVVNNNAGGNIASIQPPATPAANVPVEIPKS